MNYTSLVNNIQTQSMRTDNLFISQIPSFINRAMNYMQSQAKHLGFQKEVSGNFIAGNPLLNKPIDWKESISFSYGIPDNDPLIVYLTTRSREFCTLYWFYGASKTDRPLFYADNNLGTPSNPGQFLLSPTPDQNYQYTLLYVPWIAFDSLHPSNFLTEIYENLVFYRCMMEAMTFTQQEGVKTNYEKLYNEALKNINFDSSKGYTDRSTIRDVT